MVTIVETIFIITVQSLYSVYRCHVVTDKEEENM